MDIHESYVRPGVEDAGDRIGHGAGLSNDGEAGKKRPCTGQYGRVIIDEKDAGHGAEPSGINISTSVPKLSDDCTVTDPPYFSTLRTIEFSMPRFSC